MTHLSTKKCTHETRYYISSAKKRACEFQKAVKNHWPIENKLHWHLDVSMDEDDKKFLTQSVKNLLRIKKRRKRNRKFKNKDLDRWRSSVPMPFESTFSKH